VIGEQMRGQRIRLSSVLQQAAWAWCWSTLLRQVSGARLRVHTLLASNVYWLRCSWLGPEGGREGKGSTVITVLMLLT